MIRKFFASIFVLLFASLAGPLLFSWQIYENFTDPDFYTDDFYSAAHGVFLDEAGEIIKEKKISFVQDDVAINGLLKAAVPQASFNKILRDIVDQIWNTNLHGEKVLNLKVDFAAALKDNDKFYDAVFVYLQKNLPVCPEGDNIEVGTLSCLDKNVAKDDFKAQVRAALDRELFLDIPNESAIELPFAVETTLSDFGEKASGVVFSFYLSTLMLALLLTALIVYRPWERVVSWLSGAVFFAALHVIILAVGVLYIVSNLDGAVAALIGVTFGLIAEKLLYYYGIPIAILSLLAWILIFLRLRKQDKTL